MESKDFDVLIIGAGAAGLRTAIELHDHGKKVCIVGKSKKRDAHTVLATGGINAALGNMDPADSWQLHMADTIRDGGLLNDPKGVELLTRNAPRAIQELADWGARFHREADGRISQRFFGAATYRRACFVGDETGKEIQLVLARQAEKRRMTWCPEVYIFSLLQNRGRVNGAIGFDINTGKIQVYHAQVVVLATGGFSRLFARSSSRIWENNGDGIALAVKVGAKCMDMEMFQFHPTGMLSPKKAEGILVTEAVRGEGGKLTNVNGERFMKRTDAERMELSARDVVARAIYWEVAHGRGTKNGGVWLDISHRDKAYIRTRLPKMYRQFKEVGVDITRQKMEVGPTAHYSMGGLHVDFRTGQSSVPGLFAVGEVTAGMHGANRLGGNSLLECMVFGRLTAHAVLNSLRSVPIDDREVQKKLKWLESFLSVKGRDPLDVKGEMQKLMWEHVGVVRTEKSLQVALQHLVKYRSLQLRTGTTLKNNRALIAALDIQGMLPTSEMVIRSALLRTESRGAHYRSDYPERKPVWRKHIICTPGQQVRLSTIPVGPIPHNIQRLIEKEKPQVHLLE